MRITGIRATPVNLPLEAPYLWSYGSLAGFSKTIVEVETSDGLIGLGEAPSPAAAHLIETSLAPRLIGRDPFDGQGAEEVCVPGWRGLGTDVDFGLVRAFASIDMALWDIRGKAWGQPVYKLLGGAHRTAIPFTDYFSFREQGETAGGERTIEAVVDYCLRLKAEHGTTMFEGKFSDSPPAVSIRLLEALRQALGPEALLRIDSNKAYSLTEARRIASAIAPLDIRCWEDPVGSFEEMAALRRHCSIPFSVHTPDLRRAVALGVPDVMCTDICVHGGIGRTQRFIAACEAMGVDFWFYSGDSGIASAAYMHLAAATPHIREPSQSLFRQQPVDVINEGPFTPHHNRVAVPHGPGLGVTLAPDKLAYCHRHFVENGAFDKFHDPDRPGMLRRLPLM